MTRHSLHTILFTARCGQIIVQRTVTIGALDGPFRSSAPDTTDGIRQEIQTMVDSKRQAIADEASWKEMVRLAVQQVD